MILAVPVKGNITSGPGEAEEIAIVDTAVGKVSDRYPNPALTATSARGIAMVRSALDRRAEGLVVGGIGEHALTYAMGRMKVYNGSGLTLDDLTKPSSENNLTELLQATHTGSHHHH